MYSIRPNVLLRSLYPSAIWRIPTKEKQLFLTFDDGPIPEITPQVLSILKEYKAKATFFCVGANIEKHSEVFQQIIAEGHSVGNHTFNHLNGWKTKTKDYLENIQKCNEQMCRYADVQMKNEKNNRHIHSSAHPHIMFRPPYGKMKRSQISLLTSRYSLIMWDVLSGDFDLTISKEKCLKNVISKTREGSIVVFHDSLKAKENVLFTLPKFIEHFSKEGFGFYKLPSP